MPSNPEITAALRAAADAMWAAYQAAEGVGAEHLRGITIEELRRWAVTKGDGNAAAQVLRLVEQETAAAVAAFLRALPDVIQSVPFASNSDGMMHARQAYFAGDLAAAVEAAAHE